MYAQKGDAFLNKGITMKLFFVLLFISTAAFAQWDNGCYKVFHDGTASCNQKYPNGGPDHKKCGDELLKVYLPCMEASPIGRCGKAANAGTPECASVCADKNQAGLEACVVIRQEASCKSFDSNSNDCTNLCKLKPSAAVCPKAEKSAPVTPAVVDKPKPKPAPLFIKSKSADINYDSCKWVEDMPRKIVKGPASGGCKDETRVCMGYVSCDSNKAGAPKVVRLSTCAVENCTKGGAGDCTKQAGFYSMRPVSEKNETLSDNVQKAIGLKE